MPNRTVDLTDQLDAFVDGAVASGTYGDASEVIREALHLLQQQHREDDAKLRRLREEVQVGLDAMAAGDYVEMGMDEVGDYLDELARPDGPREEVMRRWRR